MGNKIWSYLFYACKKLWFWENHPHLHPYVFPPLHVSWGVEWEIKKNKGDEFCWKKNQGENERQWKMQTWKNTWKISSLIEHVTRKFHVVIMQNNNREMYKKVCCISKVVFLLIMTYGFFCCSHWWSPFSVMWFYFLFEYNYINESFAFS